MQRSINKECSTLSLWQRIKRFHDRLMFRLLLMFLFGCVAFTMFSFYQYTHPVKQRAEITPYQWAQPEVERYARRMAKEYCLNEDIFIALIQKESSWRMNAVSSVGAIGYCQLMPLTFLECRHALNIASLEVFRPDVNIRCGAYYLAKQLKQWGSYDKALAYYNAGNNMNCAQAWKYSYEILRACGLVSEYLVARR